MPSPLSHLRHLILLHSTACGRRAAWLALRHLASSSTAVETHLLLEEEIEPTLTEVVDGKASVRTDLPKAASKRERKTAFVGVQSQQRQEWNEWKKSISQKLFKDYEKERIRDASELNRRIARNRIISYIRLNEIRPLLVYIANYAEAIGKRNDYPYDDELISVVLTYLRRLLDSGGGGAQTTEEVDEAVLFIERLREDKANARPTASDSAGGSGDLQFGYDAAMKLVEPLNKPVGREAFLSSPFKLPGMTKERYKKLFAEQLDLEERNYVRAKNFCRTSRLEPMEKLIEKHWEWGRRIAEKLEANIAELSTEIPLYHFLSGIDTHKCATRLVECVESMMCQGQSLAILSELQADMSRVVLRMVYKNFLDALNYDIREVYGRIFDDYVNYYLDEELARRFTIRQWWTLCTQKHGLAPDFYPPLAELFGNSPKELPSFLTQTVLDACVFPYKHMDVQAGTKSSRSWKGKKAFHYSNVTLEEESSLLGEDEMKVDLYRMIRIDQELMDKIQKHEFQYLLFPCSRLPMKVPPRPWIDYAKCGPQYTRSQKMLRDLPDFLHTNLNSGLRQNLKDSAQARPVFDSLNDLGATPWMINHTMLKNLLTAFEMARDGSKADFLMPLSIPQHASTIPVEEFDVWLERRAGKHALRDDVPEEERNEFWRNYHANKKKRNETYGIWCWVMYRLVLASHYDKKDPYKKDYLYFPHNMDFRGRVYPISPHINHMGDDINRGLLKFAKGKQLGREGLRWLKIHCINMTGKLKRESLEARLAEAEKRLDDIIDSANHPFDGRGWWLDATDEPWQTLAACVELRDAHLIGNPEDFVSHLPIHQDGSCNGLQHYAALGRDQRGAGEVNLLPNETPNDIYSNVAKRVEEKRLMDEKSEDETVRKKAECLRAEMPDPVERKVIKQTVMTTVYGVTPYGAGLQIRRQLKALKMPTENVGVHSRYLAQLTLSCLNDAFTSSMAIKEWFRQCAATASRLLHPICWQTPLGLPVVQPYVKAAKLHNRLCLLPVRGKQVNAFPPNFVHSLDSTHMMLTALQCHRKGLSFAAVHDCYWTHGRDVDEMNRICREQFIALHSLPIVNDLSEFLQSELLKPEIVKQLPRRDLEEIKQKLEMKIALGELNLENVKDSIYFFS